MAQRALIDTCICIDYLREAQAAIYYLDSDDLGFVQVSFRGRKTTPLGDEI